MALLLAATSIADFYDSTVPGVSAATTTSARKATYCKEAAGIDGVTEVLDFTAGTSTCWLSFEIFKWNSQYQNSDNQVLLYSDQGEAMFRIRSPQGTAGTGYFEVHNGTSWDTLITWTFCTSDVKYRYDIKIVVADSGGEVEIFRDGVSQGSYSGDTKRRTGTQVASLRLDGTEYFDNVPYFSAVFVCDEDTRSMEYIQTKPSSAGNYTTWDGAYTDIDEIGINDGDDISTQDAGDQSTFGQGTITTDFDSGYDVIGVAVMARARKATDTSQSIKMMVRSGTTDGVGGASALSLTFLPHFDVFDNDPATGSAWTISAAKSAEIGVESV